MADAEQQPEVKYYGLTIPVHVEIDATQVVLTQPEMQDLLRGARIVALGNCGCRRDAAVCDHPLEVCLAIDDEGQEEIEKHAWRKVSVDEALEVLETSHRAGLVHVAYRKKDEPITMVCSCCTCACNPLRRLKGRDYREEITESAFVTRFDAAACVGCGTCVGRCPFEAFSWGDGSGVSFDEKQCFGCGLCVSTCPAGALALVRRSSGSA